MRIAILGATSQIAKDLTVSFSSDEDKYLHLFARRSEEVKKWLATVGLSERYLIDDFHEFGKHEYDADINFVDVGNPAQPLVPKLSFVQQKDGSIISPPLEDLSPLLPRAEMKKNMLIGLHLKSNNLEINTLDWCAHE